MKKKFFFKKANSPKFRGPRPRPRSPPREALPVPVPEACLPAIPRPRKSFPGLRGPTLLQMPLIQHSDGPELELILGFTL